MLRTKIIDKFPQCFYCPSPVRVRFSERTILTCVTGLSSRLQLLPSLDRIISDSLSMVLTYGSSLRRDGVNAGSHLGDSSNPVSGCPASAFDRNDPDEKQEWDQAAP